MAIWSIGTWPGPSTMHLHAGLAGALGEFAEGVEFGELGGVGGVGAAAGAEAVAEGIGDVVLAHDGGDFVEEFVHGVFFVVDDHPFGEQ